MEVIILPTSDAVATLAADLVEAQVHAKPHAVLGVATGSSPVAVYDQLGRRLDTGLSFARTQIFTLDEYVGLNPEHPERYLNVIQRDLVAKIDVDPDAVHGPDGLAVDLRQACADYEGRITGAGGIDLQILGIGTDGHVAFNEPGSSLGSRTRVKTLTQQTRHDNARYFGGDVGAVPLHCLTQGMATIMDARSIVLIGSGATKATAVEQLVEGPISARWPATLLQLHPAVTVVIDAPAASRLQLTSYYQHTYDNKPNWQQPLARVDS